MVRIQTVCGFGCGSSLFLKMKVEEVLKEHNLEAEIFCGDVATCVSTPCDAIFISEELAERIKDRARNTFLGPGSLPRSDALCRCSNTFRLPDRAV